MKINPRAHITPEPKTPEQQLREVATMYEKQFLGEMLKAMRSTVQESGFIETNHAEKIFRDQLDNEYVGQWGDRGGIGLNQVIYDQLVEKFGAQLGIKVPEQRPEGPIAVDARRDFSVRPQVGKTSIDWQFQKSAAQLGVTEISSPWDGVLLGKKQLSADEQLLEIGHDHGLKSTLTFRGSGNPLKVGDKVQAGDTVGLLGPEAKGFFWRLQGDAETVSE